METFKNGDLKISVRNLVEFILRTGNIDNRRTSSADHDAMQQGSRLHKKIQKKQGSNYEAEVPMRMTIPFDEFTITVEGRADGVIKESEGWTIDEIKCVYRHLDTLKEPISVHYAQAMCYAYMYAVRENASQMTVQLTYCHIPTEELRYFRETLSFVELEKWFLNLVQEYYKWAKFLYEAKKKRKESIQGVEFPFPYRKGQRDLVVSVYKTIRQSRDLFIQAPTGIGKTMSTIFPAVKAVGEELADKIFYLTAKTITRTVACEAYEILRKNGVFFRTIVITAKEKICAMEEMECNPFACSRAKGHYDRVNDAMYDILTQEENITREVIEDYAKKHEVCPFELGLDLSDWVDGIICDYNYVFDPTVQLKRYFADGNEGEYVFLVDEAHNLVDRAREMYSAVLYRESFTMVKNQMEIKSRKIFRGMARCEEDLTTLKRECESYMILSDAQLDAFVLHLLRLHSDLDEYLQEHLEFDGRAELLEFYFDIGNFLNIYECVDEYYRIYCEYQDGSFKIRLFCMNPSRNLKKCMAKGISTIFFSATLLPVTYYKELLSGNLEDYAIYVPSPFEQKNRKLLLAEDVSSKYTLRGDAMYQKMARYILAVCRQKVGNYMAFFPSYYLMEAVLEKLQNLLMDDEEETIEILMQKSNMSEEERETFIERFEGGKQKGILIGLCVLGGIFSEGIDLTRDRLIGSLIIGTGLPQVCTEREILKDYFDQNGKNGFNYSYRYPGMNKVLQGAGRVIRTGTDVGVICLMDGRFLEKEYQRLFPREWNDVERTREDSVSEQVKKFWEVGIDRYNKEC